MYTEIQLERVVEQIFNPPMPQIMEDIVEVENIVEIPFLQIDFFVVVTFFFVLWHGALRIVFFNSPHLN